MTTKTTTYRMTTTTGYYEMESDEVESVVTEHEAEDIKEEEKPDNWCDNWPWCFYKN